MRIWDPATGRCINQLDRQCSQTFRGLDSSQLSPIRIGSDGSILTHHKNENGSNHDLPDHYQRWSMEGDDFVEGSASDEDYKRAAEYSEWDKRIVDIDGKELEGGYSSGFEAIDHLAKHVHYGRAYVDGAIDRIVKVHEERVMITEKDGRAHFYELMGYVVQIIYIV